MVQKYARSNWRIPVAGRSEPGSGGQVQRSLQHRAHGHQSGVPGRRGRDAGRDRSDEGQLLSRPGNAGSVCLSVPDPSLHVCRRDQRRSGHSRPGSGRKHRHIRRRDCPDEQRSGNSTPEDFLHRHQSRQLAELPINGPLARDLSRCRCPDYRRRGRQLAAGAGCALRQ